MSVSSELTVAELKFILSRCLHFISNNVIKDFIKSSWLGFSTLLYIHQEKCKLLVWLITVAGSGFQL